MCVPGRADGGKDEKFFFWTYGAKRLKALWILLAVRLVIPYNYTLPWAEVRLLIQPDDVLPDFVRAGEAGETEETGKISVSKAVTGADERNEITTYG